MARTINKTWSFRIKNNQPTVWYLEEKWWLDLWVRSDMKLSTYLWQNGFPHLQKILEHK